MLETRSQQAAQESDRGAYQYDGYGLGWNLGTFHDQRLMQHNGGFPGFATHVSLLPDAGYGVAVFANEGFAGSQLVRIPRSGHLTPIEEPEAVNAALEAFLAEVDS